MKKSVLLVLITVVVLVLTAGGINAFMTHGPGEAANIELEGGLIASAQLPEGATGSLTVSAAKASDEMVKGLPAGMSLTAVADFSHEGGHFPKEGVKISYSFPEPVESGTVAVLAYYDESISEWELAYTSISQDRRTFSANVEHFSLWGLIEAGGELFRDLEKATAGHISWGDVLPNLSQNTAEGVGVQAEPPVCEGDNAFWGGTTQHLTETGMLLWCSFSRDGDVVVRVTNSTPWTMPLRAAVSADSVSTVDDGPGSRTSNLIDDLANDVHPTGSAMRISKALVPDLGAREKLYFIPALGTLDFTYSLETVEQNWPAIQGQGQRLLKAVDSPQLVVADLILKAADSFMLKGASKGAGRKANSQGDESRTILAVSLIGAIDSCWTTGSFINELHRLHSVADCLRNTRGLKQELGKAQGNLPGLGSGSMVPEEFEEYLAKALLVFDGIDLLSYGARWVVTLGDNQRSIGLEPTAAFVNYFQGLPDWKTYITPDGLYSFSIHSDWTVREETPGWTDPATGEGLSLTIVDGNSAEVATFTTGMVVWDVVFAPNVQQIAVETLDRVALPKLDGKRAGLGAEGRHYWALNISTGSGPESARIFGQLGVHGEGTLNASFWNSGNSSTGQFGYFPGTEAPRGTSPAEPFAERARQFPRTVEYRELLRMVTSLQFTDKPAPAAEPRPAMPDESEDAHQTNLEGEQICEGANWEFAATGIDCGQALLLFHELAQLPPEDQGANHLIIEDEVGCFGATANRPTKRGAYYECEIPAGGSFLVWEKGERRS